jgi:uncharacterized oxidoreductase
MLLRADTLEAFAIRLLEAMGSQPEEARLVAKHLVDGNLKGHDSHGIGMLPRYVDSIAHGKLVPNQHAETLRDSGALRLFDGGNGYGQVIASEAVSWAIERVGSDGIALSGIRNMHHVGRVGAYGEQAADAGLISIHFVNVLTVGARTAPFGGREGRYGTNPICITVPNTESSPTVVLDFATAALAYGKVKVAYNEGKPLPEGAYVDEDGRPTTDPALFIRDHKGAMLSFGGYKASGLALVCELLAGAVTGAGVTEQSRFGPGVRNGMLSIVFDPARLVDLALIRSEVDMLIKWVRSSPPVAGGDGVLIAGEPERRAEAARRRDGVVIDDRSWEELLSAAREVGVSEREVENLLQPASAT